MAGSPGPTSPELKQALRQGPPQEVIVFEPTAHALGTGSYASVLPCQLLVQQGESVPAAAKVLHPDAASRDSAAFKLFAREALVMAKLHHRNIVRCYGLVRLPANAANLPALQHARHHMQAVTQHSTKPKRPADEGLWCMLLEMADKGSMAKLLLKQMCQQFTNIYTDGQMLQWLTDIASALAFCHSQKPKVVHRDLKQENILLKSDPKTKVQVAMLTDFGLHVRLERSRKPALRCASASLNSANQQLMLQEALASTHTDTAHHSVSASASAAEAAYMRRLSRASMNSDLFVSPAVARAHGMDLPPLEPGVHQQPGLSVDGASASHAPSWAPTLEGASNASLTVMLGVEEATQASQHYIIVEEEAGTGEGGGPTARVPSASGTPHTPGEGAHAAQLTGHRTSSTNGTVSSPRPSMLGDRRAMKASPLSNQSNAPSGSNHLLDVSSGHTSAGHAGQQESVSEASRTSPGQIRGRPSLGHSASGQSASMLARMNAAYQAAHSSQVGSDKAAGSASPFPVAGQQRAAALAAQAAQQAAMAVKPSAVVTAVQSAVAQGAAQGAYSSSNGMSAVLPMPGARPPSMSNKGEHSRSRPRSHSAMYNQYPVAGAQRAAALQAANNGGMAAYPVAGTQRAAALAAVAAADGKPGSTCDSQGLPQLPVSPAIAHLRGHGGGSLNHSSSLPPLRTGNGGSAQPTNTSGSNPRTPGGLSPALAGRASADAYHAASATHAGLLLGNLSHCSRDSWSADITRSSDYMSCVFMEGGNEGEHGSMRATMRKAMRPLTRGDIEWVYSLTGQTGSHMYMAPEVYLKQPYNEKADVFSFAVVMYELAARSMLVLTHLKGPNGFQTPDHYAAAVARHGYRPQRPPGCSDDLWHIISMCWSPDPNQRPSMGDVFAALAALLQEERVRELPASDPAHPQHSAGAAAQVNGARKGSALVVAGSAAPTPAAGHAVVATAVLHAGVNSAGKVGAGKGAVVAPPLPDSNPSNKSVKSSATKGAEPADKHAATGSPRERVGSGQAGVKAQAGGAQAWKKAGGLFACFTCAAVDEE